MFIRTKRIKKHQYAYVVKNRWTKQGPRQRVSRYLGRVSNPKKECDTAFEDYCTEDLSTKSSRQLIEELIGWELANHGFRKRNRRWMKDNLFVDLGKIQVSGVLHLNTDYLCDYTLRRLLKFKSARDEAEVGVSLAKAFVQAGIPVPGDVFVEVFQKVYTPGQSFVR